MNYGDLSAGYRSEMAEKRIEETKEFIELERYVEAESIESDLKEVFTEMVNPFAARIRTHRKPRKAQLSRVQKSLKSGEKADSIATAKQMKNSADDFQRRNPELKAKILIILREAIKSGDKAADIVKKILSFYPDVSLADEAMEFLLETTEGELHKEVQDAKAQLNKEYEREIIAGKNISEIARKTEGLGTPTTLRDLYRDITGTPRETTTLFDELSNRNPVKELKKVNRYLFHSMRQDKKTK